jgi:hypothetical protein
MLKHRSWSGPVIIQKPRHSYVYSTSGYPNFVQNGVVRRKIKIKSFWKKIITGRLVTFIQPGLINFYSIQYKIWFRKDLDLKGYLVWRHGGFFIFFCKIHIKNIFFIFIKLYLYLKKLYFIKRTNQISKSDTHSHTKNLQKPRYAQ